MRTFRLAAWAGVTFAFLIAAVSLIGQNQEVLTVSIFHWISPEQPKWTVLLSAFFLGVIFASIFFIWELVVLETRNIRLRRSLSRLERAVSAVPTTTGVSTSSTDDHSDV
jgi:hypothetical protein